ncbi:MAG TPA: SprB repeat-containing protein, partial [Flavisolibacter sp.]
TATAEVTISEPAMVLTASATGTNVLCFGGATGAASVAAEGGTAPYTYLWSNGATTAANSDVPAGTYSVTVTDANGCTATASIVLNRQAFNPSVTVTNVSCFGGQNGSLTVTGSNGVAPFQYSINGSALQTSNTFTGLSAGSYTIRVVDANGCNGFATKVITEPAAIVLTESSVTATCSDQSTGTITYNVSGGAGAVTFTWTGPNGFTSTKQNLTEVGTGTYQVTATDKNGCTVTATSFVPALPLITVTTRVTNVSCRGEANGAISLAVSGGAGNGFIFSWNNGATSNEIAGLVAGNYTVTIQDAATGCSLVQSYTITQPSSLVSMTTTRTNVTGCATLGAITVTGTGGTAPYQYRLNNGSYQPSSTFSDLQAGDYTVWTRDANGCTTSRLVTITDNGTDAYENNNSKNAAKIIAVGESINARIALANDAADWFQFTTPAGSRLYTVSLTHPSVTYAVDVYPSAKNAAALVPVSTSNGIRQYALA